MAISVGGKRGSTLANINVTPMADIMIVLLIIFMVMTPVLGREGVDLPFARSAEAKEPKDVVVTLRADASFGLGQERLATLGQLLVALELQLSERPEGQRVQREVLAVLPEDAWQTLHERDAHRHCADGEGHVGLFVDGRIDGSLGEELVQRLQYPLGTAPPLVEIIVDEGYAEIRKSQSR